MINEARLVNASLSFIRTYDTPYYISWSQRTVELAGLWHNTLPWLCGAMPTIRAAGRPSGRAPANRQRLSAPCRHWNTSRVHSIMAKRVTLHLRWSHARIVLDEEHLGSNRAEPGREKRRQRPCIAGRHLRKHRFVWGHHCSRGRNHRAP